MQKFLSFPVRPGMSGWVDCSDAYKRAWHEKFDPKPEEVDIKDTKHIPKNDIPNVIIELEADMNEAAERLDFERAIDLREQIKKLRERLES